MENWGLITYEEPLLLLDEENGSAQDMKLVAIGLLPSKCFIILKLGLMFPSVVQHELAHQWFGNLVTMDFWGGLWLNEGFATWYATLAAVLSFTRNLRN